jgi:ribonucleoside-diphosphate reductase alpha chain
VPDAIGLALEEWWRDRTLGVQQDLLASGPAASPSIPAPEPVVSRGSNGHQQELSFEAYNGGETFMGTCPDCGSQREYAEGCVKCHVCGFSECG